MSFRSFPDCLDALACRGIKDCRRGAGCRRTGAPAATADVNGWTDDTAAAAVALVGLWVDAAAVTPDLADGTGTDASDAIAATASVVGRATRAVAGADAGGITAGQAITAGVATGATVRLVRPEIDTDVGARGFP